MSTLTHANKTKRNSRGRDGSHIQFDLTALRRAVRASLQETSCMSVTGGEACVGC
jgi:hypothetical protein